MIIICDNFFLSLFFCPWKNPQDEYFLEVLKKNLEAIEGRQRLVDMEIIDPEEAYEDVMVDDNGTALDEENGGG